MGQHFKLEGVRVSYPHLVEARAVKPGDTPKFGAALIIPKTHPQLAALVSAGQQEVATMFGANPQCAIKPLPMYDGDAAPGYAGKPEYAGMMIINTGSYDPVPVANNLGVVVEPATIYSGCYADAHISIYAYGNKSGSMSKGVTFGLEGVQFRQDGDRLDNRPSASQMFAPIDGSPVPIAPGVAPAAPVAQAAVPYGQQAAVPYGQQPAPANPYAQQPPTQAAPAPAPLGAPIAPAPVAPQPAGAPPAGAPSFLG